MPDNSRPKVGPADEETRRRLLRQKLNEPTRAEGVAPKPDDESAETAPDDEAAEGEKSKKKKGFMESLKEALDPNVPRELRRGPKGKTIMDAVDEGIVEGNKENGVKK